MSWPTVELGEICKPKQWKTLSKKELLPEGYPVYGANGQIGYYNKSTHDRPTLLVGCRGSCGSIHIMPAKGYANGNAMALGELREDVVSLNYLARFLKKRGFADVITGTSQPQIIKSTISAIEIPLPPLEEQRRIAGILDAADALRRRRREALALLDTLPGAIFAEMFGNSDEIPEVPLHDLCRPKQWKTIKGTDLTASGYPVYGANGKIGFYSTYNHENPTVLITCRGATCGTINICEPKSYVTGNAMALDDPDESRIGLQFLAHALRVRGVNDAITGTAQPQITRQSLTAVSIKVPEKSKQLVFERSLNGIEEQRVRLQDQLQELETLFASLQSRAFAGEL